MKRVEYISERHSIIPKISRNKHYSDQYEATKYPAHVFLDRIDLQIEIYPVLFDEMSSQVPAESSASIRERVIKAREIQNQRFKDFKGIHCNAQMTPKLLKTFATPDVEGTAKLRDAIVRLDMSARA